MFGWKVCESARVEKLMINIKKEIQYETLLSLLDQSEL
jgi:hypothetical protein